MRPYKLTENTRTGIKKVSQLLRNDHPPMVLRIPLWGWGRRPQGSKREKKEEVELRGSGTEWGFARAEITGGKMKRMWRRRGGEDADRDIVQQGRGWKDWAAIWCLTWLFSSGPFCIPLHKHSVVKENDANKCSAPIAIFTKVEQKKGGGRRKHGKVKL